MVGTLTKQKIKEVVRSSIMLLFQHSVQFKVNLNVEALIGVTLDEKDCFIISINETVDKASIGRRSQGQLANERNISSETAIGDYIPARPHIKKKKKRDARSPGGSSRQKKSRSESGENQFGDSEDTPINVNSPRDNEPDGGSGDADENVSNELESENNKSALDPVRLCTTYNNSNSIDTDSDHTVNYDIPASTSIGSIENTNTDSNTSNADRIGATLNPPCDRDDVVMIKSENDDSNTGLTIDQDAHIPQPIPASSWHTPQGSDGGPLMSGAGYPETKVPQNQQTNDASRINVLLCAENNDDARITSPNQPQLALANISDSNNDSELAEGDGNAYGQSSVSNVFKSTADKHVSSDSPYVHLSVSDDQFSCQFAAGYTSEGQPVMNVYSSNSPVSDNPLSSEELNAPKPVPFNSQHENRKFSKTMKKNLGRIEISDDDEDDPGKNEKYKILGTVNPIEVKPCVIEPMDINSHLSSVSNNNSDMENNANTENNSACTENQRTNIESRCGRLRQLLGSSSHNELTYESWLHGGNTPTPIDCQDSGHSSTPDAEHIGSAVHNYTSRPTSVSNTPKYKFKKLPNLYSSSTATSKGFRHIAPGPILFPRMPLLSPSIAPVTPTLQQKRGPPKIAPQGVQISGETTDKGVSSLTSEMIPLVIQPPVQSSTTIDSMTIVSNVDNISTGTHSTKVKPMIQSSTLRPMIQSTAVRTKGVPFRFSAPETNPFIGQPSVIPASKTNPSISQTAVNNETVKSRSHAIQVTSTGKSGEINLPVVQSPSYTNLESSKVNVSKGSVAMVANNSNAIQSSSSSGAFFRCSSIPLNVKHSNMSRPAMNAVTPTQTMQSIFSQSGPLVNVLNYPMMVSQANSQPQALQSPLLTPQQSPNVISIQSPVQPQISQPIMQSQVMPSQISKYSEVKRHEIQPTTHPSIQSPSIIV